MSKIDIPRGEQGTTRIFSLSMSGPDARALRDDAEQQKASLGTDVLNTDGVEVFAVSDLDEVGLMGYLREGIDAREEDLRRDRAKLAALDGWVMLVHSSAFGGAPVTLSPDPSLTLIGTYAQTRPETPTEKLEAEAALPYSGTPDNAPLPAARRRNSGSIVVVILGLIVLGVLWWALR
ncbi:hypothetical protein AB2B41_08950 [Marimonas sp. MJW-29]|uniref:Uncharacterized protein n=1 Tax=Sulfitobacter sediminis TaxID=3234186 RepID=A0ABV3RL86_9RHOB